MSNDRNLTPDPEDQWINEVVAQDQRRRNLIGIGILVAGALITLAIAYYFITSMPAVNS